MAVTEHGHVGDGVYVSDDGYQMWLAANDHHNKVIALEPVVFQAVVAKAAEIWEPAKVVAMLRTIADSIESRG